MANPTDFDPKRITRLAVLGAVGVVVLIGAFGSYYSVQADEKGVVQRFGRYVATTGPGLHFKWPYGLETVRTVKTDRTHKMEFGFRTLRAGVRTEYSGQDFSAESMMLTGDLNIADVQWEIQYKIKDARDYLFNVRDVESTLGDISESVMRTVVGDRSVTEVLTTGRRMIAEEARDEMQHLMDELDSGIQIILVQLQDVNPPKPVQPSFNAVNEARQEKERMINEAMKEYNTVIPEADGKAKQTIEEAEGFALERVNESKGDVARFAAIQEEYKKAPAVTRQRMYLEVMREVLPRAGQKFIVDDGGDGVLKMMDIGAMRQMSKKPKGGGR